MKRFRGRHTGENQARHFWDVVETYHLQEKIGYFTLDNASNNDTTMKCIQTYLQNCGILFDPVTRRLRCFGHVINLVVKAFLWGEDPEAFEIEVTNYQALEKEQEELLAWRKKGPCGKLHNLLVYITRSPQRRDRFEEKVKQLHPHSSLLTLICGNETRWGGDYNSIVRALELREALEDFVSSAIRRNENGERAETVDALKWDELLPEDWDTLAEIVNVLGPFRKWQLLLQSRKHHGQLQDIFPAMDELLSHLEERKLQFLGSEAAGYDTKHMQTAINCAWKVLDK